MTTSELERAVALACWAELATTDVEHVEGNEFKTPTAFYLVMDADEAEDYFIDEAEQQWRGASSRLPPPVSLQAEEDFYQHCCMEGRGAIIAIDRVEHEQGAWLIYKTGTVQ